MVHPPDADLSTLTPSPPITATLDANEAVGIDGVPLSRVTVAIPITSLADGRAPVGIGPSRHTNLQGHVPHVDEGSTVRSTTAPSTVPSRRAPATTFTTSQGLLLMLPNLCRIASKLTPFSSRMAASGLATHALSIFGDHSDVMAARPTSFALLTSARPGGPGPGGDRQHGDAGLRSRSSTSSTASAPRTRSRRSARRR